MELVPRELAGRPSGRRRPARKPPRCVCGQCAEVFYSWKREGLCGKCQEDGSRRPKPGGAGPNVVELGGPADDGSFHYLATGEPRPAA